MKRRKRAGKLRMSGKGHDWPLWEVFIRAKGGLSHRHVGSVHAPDPKLALSHARDTYTRREEGVSLWVVKSTDIVASDPDDSWANCSSPPPTRSIATRPSTTFRTR